MAISSVTKLDKTCQHGRTPDVDTKTVVFDSVKSQRCIRLCPDLSAAAFRQKLTLELITWHRLRYLNVKASGFLNLEMAIEGLANEFNCCRKTAYRHIGRTEGLFLKINGFGQRTTIQIYGLRRVCDYFGITLTDKHWRMVTTDQFCTMGKARAELYASIFKPQGVRANPISRQTLTERTGLHKVQQRRYEQTAHVKRTPNFAFFKGTNPLGQWNYHPLKQEIFTKKGGHYTVPKRLGNSYHTRQLAGSTGMLRKVNRKLKRSLIPDEAPTLIERFFSSYRKLVRGLIRRTRLGEERFYLINNAYRKVLGRLEWCYYED